MYLKWILCNVAKDKNQQFSDAQEKWNEKINAYGFIAQTGGWDLENKACIISLWDNKESLDYFMKTLHDKIVDRNQQAETYDSIDITHFDSMFEIKGSSGSLGTAIKIAKFLQIVNYRVKKEKMENFEKVQKDFELPLIKRSKGMLGGILSKAADNTPNYLMLTFWNTMENYNNYVNKELLISLKKENIDIEQIIKKKILLVDSWKIIK